MDKIKMAVVIEHPGATPSGVAVVVEIRRDGPLCAGSLGLSPTEAKGLLAAVQSRLTRACSTSTWPRSGAAKTARRWTRDWRTVHFRSPFGVIERRVPRLHRCACADPRRGAEKGLDEAIEVSVTDNGIGVPEAYREKIFYRCIGDETVRITREGESREFRSGALS